jgi:fatty-acyl-CoA synthase
MATLVVDGALNFAELRRHLAKRLPDYARPLFLRIKDRIEVTATFKYKTSELAGQGFDPALISDPIYFDNPEQQAYVPLDQPLYRRIGAGQIRL